jgi:hypothetical protein
MKIYLPEGLDQKFRKAAMNAYGYGRGSISKAATEAISEWCSKYGSMPAAASERVESTKASRVEPSGVRSEFKNVNQSEQEQFPKKRENPASMAQS